MGQTLSQLSSRKIDSKAVFNNRFVVEVCEKVHVHYRNLRLLLSLNDFLSMANGMKDALSRWEKMGKPEPGNCHIELCRKEVATDALDSEKLAINHNKNLYPQNEGKIFSEGAEISDPTYIHLKVRDLRIELTLGEFNELAEAVAEARGALCVQPS